MSILDTITKLFRKPYGTVRPAQAADLMARGAVLLDVREPAEWRAGHAPKARHIPLGQLHRRLAELPPGRPVVTVCRAGNRSRRAAQLLAARGRRVYNLAGGMRGWTAAGLPVTAKGGGAGRVL